MTAIFLGKHAPEPSSFTDRARAMQQSQRSAKDREFSLPLPTHLRSRSPRRHQRESRDTRSPQGSFFGGYLRPPVQGTGSREGPVGASRASPPESRPEHLVGAGDHADDPGPEPRSERTSGESDHTEERHLSPPGRICGPKV